VRIGVLGGTFNPPHLGHLVCAQEAYVQLTLDRLILIPARTPPHKPVEDEPGAEHRLELCRVAARGDSRFTVSAIELERPGPSYTVDTLKALRSREPDSELFLIVGGDVAAGFAEWHEPDQVLSLARLAIAERRGTPRAEVQSALARLRGAQRAEFFEMPRIEISSTMIRRRVHSGLPIRYVVPDDVIGYIERHHLYRVSVNR
jgi:nicotinate-nucleotide adenylyltransferase